MAGATRIVISKETGEQLASPSHWKKLGALAASKPMGAICFTVIIIYWLVAVFAPWIAHSGYNDPLFGPSFAAPSGTYWFGTDNSGRDVFSRVIWASRTDLLVSVITSMIGVGAAFILGVASAYFLGWFDLVLQRIVDAIQALPGLIVLLVIAAVLGTNLAVAMAAITVLTVPIGLRIVRSDTLQVREMQYVESARALGASNGRIILRHIVPNVIPLGIILMTIALGTNLLIEASLAFLGLVSSTYPDWGTMLNVGALGYMEQAPWLALAPGLAISIIVFAYSMFGDALRDVLDPRLRGA